MNTFHPSDDPARELRMLVAGGRFREAVDTYRAAPEEKWRELPEVQLLTATSATRLGEFDLARPLAGAAAAAFRRNADRPGHMRATNLLGALAWELGAVSEAESYFGEALALAHELADSLMAARAANNLASLAQLGARHEAALSLYRSALVTYQRIGDRRGLVETYHNFGIVFRQMGELDQAHEASENATRLAEAAEDPALITLALLGAAAINLRLGDIELAEVGALRASSLAEEQGDPLSGAESARILALVRLEQDRLEEALHLATSAQQVAAQYESRLLVGEATSACALVLRGMGRDREAEEQRASARAIFTGLGATGFLAEFDSEWDSPRD